MADVQQFRGRKYLKTAIEGMDTLERRLKRMHADVRGAHLREAAAAGAELVRDVASQLAPVSAYGSHGREPGFLAENIDTAVQFTRNQDKADIHVGMKSAAFYGWFQETGTQHMPAQPFLRPALDATKEDVVEIVREMLELRVLGAIR